MLWKNPLLLGRYPAKEGDMNFNPRTFVLVFLATFALLLPACESTITSQRGGKVAEGAWVATLPSGYKTTTINGFTYYVLDGNYFVRKGTRFVAVGSPLSTMNEKAKLSNPL